VLHLWVIEGGDQVNLVVTLKRGKRESDAALDLSHRSRVLL
jgi:hypothetical protein